MSNVTYHVTEEADVLFMAAARALKDKVTGKEEYSIKLQLDDASPTVAHLTQVSEAKIDTKNNRKLQGIKHVSFSSTFAPVVTFEDGVKLNEQEIPFFDGRKDTGRAIVTYKVITYPTKTLVRLQAIKIMSLTLAPRESKDGVSPSVTDILGQLASI